MEHGCRDASVQFSFLKSEAEVNCDSLDLDSKRYRRNGMVPDNLVLIYLWLL